MVQRNLVVQAEVPYRERAVRGERRHMPLTLSAPLPSLQVDDAPYLERAVRGERRRIPGCRLGAGSETSFLRRR